MKSRLETLAANVMERAATLARTLTEDFYGEAAPAAADRRRDGRAEDGAYTEVQLPGTIPSIARILDISARGARLLSPVPLPLGHRVTCRVSFSQSSERLGLKVLWERKNDRGFEYGLAHAPIVPGTESILDNYHQRVLNRALAATA